MNLARQLDYMRRHELSTTDADELASVVARMFEALKWYASADYGPNCRADAQVRKRAAEALKGVE